MSKFHTFIRYNLKLKKNLSLSKLNTLESILKSFSPQHLNLNNNNSCKYYTFPPI